ncbi:MAG: sugar transferase [Cytophagaceae bacterium SCN 52-12]|nr:MAG: sugar transferase [Cytophagaceae bacterium SCN 52-12]
MKDQLAPVVVFCFNRPGHLRQTIEALRANALAQRSRLFVFSDGPRGEQDRERVLEVRRYIRSIDGFGNVSIAESERNRGLSRSVIEEVTGVVNEYGKVIVLEDDLVTTPDFLAVMNRLLDAYQPRQDIFSVTAYAPPFRVPAGYTKDFCLVPRASSWGWGTWADRWSAVDWGDAHYRQLLNDPRLKRQFLEGGSDLWPMLYKQQTGVIDSWAVRWCAAHAVQGAYGVYPVRSKVKNIGTDGSGTNFTFSTRAYDVEMNREDVRIEADLQPDQAVIRAFKRFYDLPLYLRLKNLFRYGI